MTEVAEPLPLRVLYGLAGAAAWIAFRLFRLRQAVIRENLARSFPGESAQRLQAIEREFVRRQGEALAELIYTPRLDAEQVRARVVLTNPQALVGAPSGRPLILVGAHHCNAEWALQRMALEFGGRFVGLYKPIRNGAVDAWFRRVRSRFGARLVPAKTVLKELARSRDVAAIGLIADQAPTTSPEKHWTAFLGQDTAFYMGPELLGRALRGQVLLGRMRRLGRGQYELGFEALNEPGERLPHGEITDRYARALETWIREDPAGWWWSHRRWKLTRKIA
jgi:Kdo2-lipid IVA lauroyltransferase/acyltransferase